MRRSKTTYTTSRSTVIDPLDFGKSFDSLSLKDKDVGSSQKNASWDAVPKKTKLSDNARRQAKNMLMKNDQAIQELLGMLRTNEFAGEIDPVHHSRYMKEPEQESEADRTRARMLESHKSDGHLLKMRKNKASLLTKPTAISGKAKGKLDLLTS